MLTQVRILVCLAFAASIAAGQTIDIPAEDPGSVITAESNLVVVPLHVYKGKKSVDGLGPEAFQLLEDGVIQKISFVEGPGLSPGEGRIVPTEIIFLLDISHSVLRPGLLDASMIQSSMLEQLREDVSVSIYGFSGKLQRFTGPTRDPGQLEHALNQAYAAQGGGSLVYEAILQAARDAASRGGNVSRMMIVFSDGFATTKFSPESTVEWAVGLGIPIYPAVLGHDRIVKRTQRRHATRLPSRGPRRQPSPNPGGSQQTSEQEARQAKFADVGRRTGGRAST